MKKVTSPATTEFETDCPMCGCSFSYDLADVMVPSPNVGPPHVTCPSCNHAAVHYALAAAKKADPAPALSPTEKSE